MKNPIMMFKKCACYFSIVLISFNGFSQTDEALISSTDIVKEETSIPASMYNQQNFDFQKHWTFGGNIGLSFRNGGTDILVAPKAYYNVSPIFLTGFGLTYIYSKYSTTYYDYQSNSFGGSFLAAIRPINFLQISAEYEGLQTNRTGGFDEKYWTNAIFLGLSFVTGNVSFGFRYDVLYDSNRSAYSSALTPVVGFYF